MKHVIITGAGSGLGLGMATRYLARGAAVSVLDLAVSDANREQLDAAAARGKSNWSFHQMDITQDEVVGDVVASAVREFGAPDLAINSAGVVLNKTIADMQPAEFRRVIDINLNGSLYFSQACVRFMRPGARLALVASLAGLTSNYAYGAYGASKFGVVGLATTLRYEYHVLGINISCICPPEVNTPLVEGERKTGNPISLALKKTAGCMNAEDACDQILSGLDAGRWMIIPGIAGKITSLVARHMPGLFNGYIQMMVRKLSATYSGSSAAAE